MTTSRSVARPARLLDRPRNTSFIPGDNTTVFDSGFERPGEPACAMGTLHEGGPRCRGSRRHRLRDRTVLLSVTNAAAKASASGSSTQRATRAWLSTPRTRPSTPTRFAAWPATALRAAVLTRTSMRSPITSPATPATPVTAQSSASGSSLLRSTTGSTATSGGSTTLSLLPGRPTTSSFPGFNGEDGNYTLGYALDMAKAGVPVVFGYLSDAHDCHNALYPTTATPAPRRVRPSATTAMPRGLLTRSTTVARTTRPSARVKRAMRIT